MWKTRGSKHKLMFSLLHVLLDVQCKMIWSSKGSFTHFASIGSDSSVFSHVSSQLIWSWELPATTLPSTNIGFLSSVRPQVSLHVRGFVIGLQTSIIGTVMNLRNLLHPPHLPHLHWKLQWFAWFRVWCWCCYWLSWFIGWEDVVVVVLWW